MSVCFSSLIRLSLQRSCRACRITICGMPKSLHFTCAAFSLQMSLTTVRVKMDESGVRAVLARTRRLGTGGAEDRIAPAHRILLLSAQYVRSCELVRLNTFEPSTVRAFRVARSCLDRRLCILDLPVPHSPWSLEKERLQRRRLFERKRGEAVGNMQISHS